jgi:hypothetical protein
LERVTEVPFARYHGRIPSRGDEWGVARVERVDPGSYLVRAWLGEARSEPVETEVAAGGVSVAEVRLPR